MRTGTSMRGPTTPARAWPEVAPRVATATVMASSKLFPAAVNASVVARGWSSPAMRPTAMDPAHITAKYASSGSAIRTTSSGFEVMASR